MPRNIRHTNNPKLIVSYVPPLLQTMLATGSYGKCVRLDLLADGTALAVLDHAVAASLVMFSLDSRLLAVALEDFTVGGCQLCMGMGVFIYLWTMATLAWHCHIHILLPFPSLAWWGCSFPVNLAQRALHGSCLWLVAFLIHHFPQYQGGLATVSIRGVA